jgi:hypothetical protein
MCYDRNVWGVRARIRAPCFGKEDFMKRTLISPLGGAVLWALTALLPGAAAAQQCPDVGLNGAALTYNPAGDTQQVVAGGNIDLSACLDLPGNGFLAEAPDFELTVGAGAGDIQLAVASGCDTTLLVNDAGGQWLFSDDEDGSTSPRLVISGAAEGIYDIWVGTFDPATCDASLTIGAASGATPGGGGGVTPGTGTCPDPNLAAAAQLAYDISELASPQVFPVVAGGDLDLSLCSDVPGIGYIIQGPDYEMALTGNAAGQDVELRVESECDTVLFINDAAGEYQFVDDAEGGLNPVLVLPAAMDGIYDIWIGTLNPETCEATFSISVPGGVAPSGGKGPAAPAVEEPAVEEPAIEEPAPTGGKGPAAPAVDPVSMPTMDAMPDPGNMAAFRADVGAIMAIEVTGSTDGFVWGSDVYTDDSDVSTAAVHAGVIASGETGVVTVEMLGPQSAFAPSNRNGVNASAFGSWGGSFGFIAG